ncbi:uncharacterized protein LOC107039273 [Diachasma alloeum]|uniref:uncharacterized protein LOC107039273 n=1 Tax=Diachasma alloeum TaxID=454923 RepID=UPI0007381FF8|nr:uncharacterized protein LOC107039273 [Diachasma alloeum]
MNASTLKRAIAVLGKFLPPEEMAEYMEELMQLNKPKVKWDFNLSEALTAYMESVEGRTLNYSETALIIQNSAHVFETRVEKLYQDTCGLRKTLDEHEAEHEAAKASKPRQRSHRKVLDLDKIERFDYSKETTKNCFLKHKKSQKKIKLLSQRYPQLENTCRHKFSLNVMDTQGEKMGKKYDFRCNQQLTSSLMLVDELSPDDLHEPPRGLPESSFHHDSIPSCSTPYPPSPGPSSLPSHPQEDPPPNPPVLPSTSPPRSSSSPTPSQAQLDPQDTSDFDTNDFCDPHDTEPLDQTEESGYCTFTDISTSGTLSSTQRSTEIHENSPSEVPPSPPAIAPDRVGLETPPENPSPIPPTPISSQLPEPSQEDSTSLQRKRNRESVETDAGYTSGGPDEIPKSPDPTRRSKRIKESVMSELNENSYQAIPFQGPIPEKSVKRRATFKLPCDPSLLRTERPRKRKSDGAAGKDQRLKKHLMSETQKKSKMLKCSPFRSLCDHYREAHQEGQRIVEESLKMLNVSQFEAVFGENDDLKGFSLRGKTGDLSSNTCLGKSGAAGDGKEEMTLKLGTGVVDHRLQELQETSCSYTPPHSPEFSGGFGIGGEDEHEEEEDLVETESSSLTHQQKIERRMKELQKEFDVKHDREEETARWFDMMETLRAAERRPVFDVREYEEKIVRGLTDESGNRLGFQELAWREEPEDIARLFVASLHLANTYTVDITTSEDTSNVHLSLLKLDESHPS